MQGPNRLAMAGNVGVKGIRSKSSLESPARLQSDQPSQQYSYDSYQYMSYGCAVAECARQLGSCVCGVGELLFEVYDETGSRLY